LAFPDGRVSPNPHLTTLHALEVHSQPVVCATCHLPAWVDAFLSFSLPFNFPESVAVMGTCILKVKAMHLGFEEQRKAAPWNIKSTHLSYFVKAVSTQGHFNASPLGTGLTEMGLGIISQSVSKAGLQASGHLHPCPPPSASFLPKQIQGLTMGPETCFSSQAIPGQRLRGKDSSPAGLPPTTGDSQAQPLHISSGQGQ
jgi:hypothetical protein